ncbi:MAG: PCRF domain-containing protein, partial [Erysipelotrichaceae bacterium]|nr:PCRF domain-containing protein [Erysipelotrichaceae bacterium]
MDAVREKLRELQKQYDEISEALLKEENLSDPKTLTKLSKEQARLQQTVDAWKHLQELDTRIEEANELLNEDDPE